MNSSPKLCLRLFGGPSIEREDGTPLAGRAVQRHRLALLALLALSPGRAASREKVMACLWPESDMGRARNLLNVSVYLLRKRLGDVALRSTGNDLRLDPAGIRMDVLDFEAALDRDDPAGAVALYRGPLLDGFFLSEAPEFERWADRERERLAGCYARALETLAVTADEQGDSPGAAQWWRARAAHDPYDSRVALRLMQALDDAGNRAGALQHATLHDRLLREEFGAEPDTALLELAERIRLGGAESPKSAEPAAERTAVVLDPATPASSGAAVREGDQPPVRQSGEGGTTAGAAPLAWGRWAAAAAVALLLAAAAWALDRAFREEPMAIRRVAVLPLANLTGDPQQEYFVAGMHDALVAELRER